jgi:hypothetical protein
MISSPIASPVAGALSMPQTLSCNVAFQPAKFRRCVQSVEQISSSLCRLSMLINFAFGEFRQRLVGLLFFSQSQIEQRNRLV